MQTQLQQLLVCPCCYAKLEYIEFVTKQIHANPDISHFQQALHCKFENLYYPIKNNIPLLATKYVQTIDLD